MATRTTPGEGDYNLSQPINSFIDVARRVVLQPQPHLSGVLGSPGRHRALRGQPVVADHTRSSVGAHVLVGHPQRGALH